MIRSSYTKETIKWIHRGMLSKYENSKNRKNM